MNERARELARRVVGKHRSDVASISLFDEQIDQFAEMLIKECLHVIDQESDKVFENWRCKDGQHIWWKLKEHFGVQV